MMNNRQACVNQINQMWAAYAQAEIRIAKQLQEFGRRGTWTEALKEAKILVARHGVNIELIKE